MAISRKNSLTASSDVKAPNASLPNTRKMLEALFSEGSISQERNSIKNNHPEIWDQVSPSYQQLDAKKAEVRSLLSGVSLEQFKQFKQFLSDKGANAQLAELAQLLSEETEPVATPQSKR